MGFVGHQTVRQYIAYHLMIVHQGYNHAWVLDEKRSDQTKPITLWSPKSGIKVDISTNQPSVQVYTAFWLDVASKAIHGGPSSRYGRWSAVAIEQQGHVDAINTPEWGIDQIRKSFNFYTSPNALEMDPRDHTSGRLHTSFLVSSCDQFSVFLSWQVC